VALIVGKLFLWYTNHITELMSLRPKGMVSFG
jgi:hypothetical protein